MVTDLDLLRLLQLVSPSTPTGAYSYSQGMETAVHEGWVYDEASTRDWIRGCLMEVLTFTDLPLFFRLHDAWGQGNVEDLLQWSLTLRACRETAELRFEDQQVGQALMRVLRGLGVAEAEQWLRHPLASFSGSFALASVRWSISAHPAAIGLAWNWLENQVLSAMKLIPLGQGSGQTLLHGVARDIPAAVARAQRLEDHDIGRSAFAVGLASSRHEVQYSRLFRS